MYTPHIQAIIIPTVKHDRLGVGLACTEYLGGRKKLRDLQDSYAATMNPLGLNRGMKGSKAKHENIKNFYSVIDSDDIPTCKMPGSHIIRASHFRIQPRKPPCTPVLPARTRQYTKTITAARRR